MKQFSAEQINSMLEYQAFIPFLKDCFQSEITVPDRTHHDMPNGTLLMMPAWNEEYLGIKLATVHPENKNLGLPSIHATYLLQSAKTGEPLALFDGKALTIKRTAAASALAASFLAKEDATKLLMIGNGALAPELIKAHTTVRPIKEVLIWGRNEENVEQLIQSTDWNNLQVQRAENLQDAIHWADIISCATMSKTPLVEGAWLSPGQHIDLVGSYKPDMREADDAVIQRASIFVDTLLAMKESGDLALPLKNGRMIPQDIQADLKALCIKNQLIRKNNQEITVFKSVGFALEDLAAAAFIFQKTES
ncbi:MAG: ornithine cyclodeaminase family protein [Saprospiraceae bacterium]|nr:ornithine cyclodeaminase family protein [Saprospiraceae bacterium]